MATDFFLKLDTIEGEATQQGYEKQIDISSLQLGLGRTATVGTGGSGLTTGKANFSDVSFTKNTDKASPKLWQACASGTHIPTAVFAGRKSVGDSHKEYFNVKLTDVVITGFSNSGSDGGDAMMESVSFAYSKIEFTQFEFDSKGAMTATNKAGYDLSKGVKV